MCRSIRIAVLVLYLIAVIAGQQTPAAATNAGAVPENTATPTAASATIEQPKVDTHTQQPAVPKEEAPPTPATPAPAAAQPVKVEAEKPAPATQAIPTPVKTEEPVAPTIQNKAVPIADSPVIEIPVVNHTYKPTETQPEQSVQQEDSGYEEADVQIEDVMPVPPESNPIPQHSPEELQRQQQMEHEESLARQSVNLDYGHVRSYSFHLTMTQDFLISVSSDHQVKGIINVYWQQDRTYIMSGYRQGEEVTLLIYGGEEMVFNKQFYQSTGFKFQAKKGVQYLLRFDKVGMDKLLLLHINNYISSDHVQETMADHSLHSSHERGLAVLNKLKVFLEMAENNAIINDQISENVLEHTQAYMFYQAVEIVFVILATVSQFYMIRKLVLGSTSVV